MNQPATVAPTTPKTGPTTTIPALWVFLVAGLACFLLALSHLVKEPEMLTGDILFGNSRFLGVLLIPGWLASMVFVCGYALLPMIAVTSLWSRTLVSVHLVLHIIGCYWLATGFARASEADASFGAVLLFAGMLLFVINLVVTSSRLNLWEPAHILFNSSLFWLVITGLGYRMLPEGSSWIPESVESMTQIHLAAPIAVAGFFWMGLLATALKLTPLLLKTLDHAGMRSWIGIALMNIGMLILIPSHLGAYPNATWIGGIPFLAGTALIVLDLLLLSLSARQKPDSGMMVAGLGILFGIGLFVWTLMIPSPELEPGAALPDAESIRMLSILILFGSFAPVLLGIGTRIAPLLTGLPEIGAARFLSSSPRIWVCSLCILAGMLYLIAGTVLNDLPSIQLGAIAFIGAASWFAASCGQIPANRKP
jgi:hypothetical protein